MNINKSNMNAHSPLFSGHKKVQDKSGYEKHNFFYLYDYGKYDCEVELYNIVKDSAGNLSIKEKRGAAVTLPMRDGGISADLSEYPQLNSQDGFAYRFKLTDKKTNETSYAFDNGSVIGIFDTKNSDNKYNVVLNNRAMINKNGPMQLIMPDEYYPGVINDAGKPVIDGRLRKNSMNAVRTHANKLGGNFYGIIKRLPEIEKEGVKRIVGTPFTKDTISSHKYWTENAYQVAPDLGSEEDFKQLQTELFKHGINWIADAALVNEGFGGIHMSELLRNGSNSYSKNMFRADEKISLGILPDKSDYTRMKIINAPFTVSDDGQYTENNSDYNPAKPTYIQFYDERLASEEQKKSDSPNRLRTYDNKNTDNIYEITKHDDAVYPFPVEVSPRELERNIKKISKQKGTVDLSDIDTIKKAADFTNFNVVNKSAAGGLEVWDGNVDIAKLNFYRNPQDNSRFTKLPYEKQEEAIADFDRGALAVRDYAVNSGKYWTKLTDDTQFEYAADVLSQKHASNAKEYMSAIKSLSKAGDLPSSVLENIDEETIENVLNDNYHLRRLDETDYRADINPENSGNDYTMKDYILRQSMDLPLETLPFATNLLGIITSPYIAKKANTEDELGVSRYDLTKADNPNLPDKYRKVYSAVDNIYEKDITPVISFVLSDIPGISEDGNVTEFGKYVISQAAPELTKYVLVKAVAPQANVKITDDGHFDFSDVDEEEITMQSIGIPYSGKTAQEEAQILVNVIHKGIANLSSSDELSVIKQKMQERFINHSLNDYKVAEMIIDKTESGLGWRIDAAKDIASIDSVRSNSDDMEQAWNNVIDFWKLYNQEVLKINPHAYTTAEITDLFDLFKNEKSSVYTSDADAERKFIQETGITSVANYNYFFSLLPDLFCITYPFSDVDNPGCWMGKENKNFSLRNKLDTGWGGNPGFLFQSPEDGIVNSYTFIGNHDKPRILHCLSLDLGLFYSDFKNAQHQAAAAEVLKKNPEDINFSEVSSKAVAMGSRLNTAFDAVIKDEKTKNNLKNAVADLADGIYSGKKFDAEAFGTRPFEVAIKTVFNQAERESGKIQNRSELEAQVLKSILTPAFDRFYSIYKLLITLPGSPTDFAGDKVGATGFETKAKNYHQQNRNIIHWEWLENDNNDYKFVKDFYKKMNEISNLRSRTELSALNDGATVTIPIAVGAPKIVDKEQMVNANEHIQAMLRYNDKGSVVLTLHDSSGSETPFNRNMKRTDSVVSGDNSQQKGAARNANDNLYNMLVLDADGNNAKQGLKHGLAAGSAFKNAQKNDDSVYKIVKIQKNNKDYYCLKRYNSIGQEIPIKIDKKNDYNTLILYKV